MTLPAWLRQKAPAPEVLAEMKALLDRLSLHTVCESAHCPNQGVCFTRGTATFLIMGDVCTRNCRFCAVTSGVSLPLDPHEPANLAEAVSKLNLRYVVVTSVTRDDLPDGGAQHFAATIEEIRRASPRTQIEVLIPDFRGSLEALKTVVEKEPEVLNHNVETVPRLYPTVRPQADYKQSVELLGRVKQLDRTLATKSGLMLGLGEERREVIQVMEDLRGANCDFLTIGQYLRPSPEHHPVVRFVTPEEFEEYRRMGVEMGFRGIASGPFVRSSYNAAEMYGAFHAPAE